MPASCRVRRCGGRKCCGKGRKGRFEQKEAKETKGRLEGYLWLPVHLWSIAEACRPRLVFFVLRNHDFYGSSFEDVDPAVANVCAQHPNLRHLGRGEVIPLTADSTRISHRDHRYSEGTFSHNVPRVISRDDRISLILQRVRGYRQTNSRLILQIRTGSTT